MSWENEISSEPVSPASQLGAGRFCLANRTHFQAFRAPHCRWIHIYGPGIGVSQGGKRGPAADTVPWTPSSCLWLPAPFQNILGFTWGLLGHLPAKLPLKSAPSYRSRAKKVWLTSCCLSCPKEKREFIVPCSSRNKQFCKY